MELASKTDAIDWNMALALGYGTDSTKPGCGGFCASAPTFPNLLQVSLKPGYDFGGEFAKDYPEFMNGLKAGKLVCFSTSSDSTFFEGDSGGPSIIGNSSGRILAVGVHSMLLGDDNGNVVAACDVGVGPFRDSVLAQ